MDEDKDEGMGKDQDPLEPVQRPAAVELDRHEQVIQCVYTL